jgi:hypothetical protein
MRQRGRARQAATGCAWNRITTLPIVDVDKSAEIGGLKLGMAIARRFLRYSEPPFDPIERSSFVFVIEPVISFADIFIERP